MYRNLMLATVAAVAMAPTIAEARTERRIVFNVAGGDLATVIDDIARQARTQILYDREVVSGKTAPPITGRLTVSEAVAAAVGANGLVVQKSSKDRIEVLAPGAASVDDIVVTAARGSFTATDQSTLTRTATPRRKTPGTIDVVTADAFEARNATSFEDILKNVPGVVSAPTGAGVQTALIRGDLSQNFQQGGLATTANGTTAPIGGVDHVEVFKGPTALLQGSAAGGGLINYVPKTGSLTPIHSLTFTGGTNAFTQVIADIGGPINAAGTLGFRLIGQSDHGRTNEYGFDDVYERLITPKLRFKTDRTLIDIDYQYYEKRTGLTTFAYYTRNPSDPNHGTLTPYGNQLDRSSGNFNRSNRVAGSMEQTLVDNDSLKLQFRPRVAYEWGISEIRSGGGYIPPAPNPYYLLISSYAERKQLSAYGDLYAKFDTGPAQHQLILGYDYQDGRLGSVDDQVIFPFYNTFPYVTPGTIVYPAPVPKADVLNRYHTRQQGYIIQDQINIGPVHILAAARHSIFDRTTRTVTANYAQLYALPAAQEVPTYMNIQYVTYTDRPSEHQTRWDPSGGVVVDIVKQLSVYGSYTSTFIPQITGQATRSDGTPLPPQVRKQYEVGAKLGLFDERLQFTASAYKYSTNNQAYTDPSNVRYAISGPGRRAKGFELSATGAINRSTNIIAGYGYVDVKADLPASYGFGGVLRVPAVANAWAQGVPRNTANLFVTHDVRSGPLSGFGLGLGGNYTSGYGYLYNPTRTTQAIGELSRAFVSIDAAVRYSIGPVRLNLTVTNLFNRFNVYPSSIIVANGSQIPIAPGREGKLSARLDF